MQELFSYCLENGLRLASLKELYELNKEKLVDDNYFVSSNVFSEGNFKEITTKEMKGVKAFLSKGNQLIWFGGLGGVFSGIYSLYAYNQFDSSGWARGVCIPIKPRKVKQ